MPIEELPPTQRLIVAIAVMIATLMQVLDTTIVNVALPHMQGSLGTTPDQITWVLTSYLVASAIFMPLTGYLSERLGRKNYLLWSIFGFVVTSVLCGAATSLTQIVVFRLLQGVFGAALVPLAQAILVDIYPLNERGKATAIWGVGVMVGPVLGPTLGGYLTEVASWRWNFYINVPFGMISLLLAWEAMPDTQGKSRGMDWLGLTFLSTAIGSFQYFLDRGNTDDWFSSMGIRIAALLSALGMLGFIVHSYDKKTGGVFDFAILKDRNFMISGILLFLFGFGLFGALVVAPLMLENLFHYPVLTTGLVMAPRGLSAMLSMIVASKLIGRVDFRILIIVGALLNAGGMWIGTFYNLQISPGWVMWPLVMQGFGLGMTFVTLTNVAFTTLPAHLRTEAAGLFSLLRTMGSSVGISVVANIFTRHAQIAWNQLGGFIEPYNPAVYTYLRALGLQLNDPFASVVLARELSRQAQMLSFVDAYAFMAASFLVVLPLVFFIVPPKNANKEVIMASD